MAAWHRTPEQGAGNIHHIHAVVVGHPLLHPEAADQVGRLPGGRNGLATHAPDDGPRLNPIPRPVWPWPPEEDDMINDQDFEKLTRMFDDRIRAATRPSSRRCWTRASTTTRSPASAGPCARRRNRDRAGGAAAADPDLQHPRRGDPPRRRPLAPRHPGPAPRGASGGAVPEGTAGRARGVPAARLVGGGHVAPHRPATVRPAP